MPNAWLLTSSDEADLVKSARGLRWSCGERYDKGSCRLLNDRRGLFWPEDCMG